MAFFLQYRNLRKRIEEQLNEFKDAEKGTSAPSPRLSGVTTTGEGNTQADAKPEESDQSKEYDSKDFPYAKLDGISVEAAENGEQYYQVSWESANDPQNPKNWSTISRLRTTLILISIAYEVTAASSIDSAVARPAAMEFGVSEVVEALGGTAVYLIGFGLGALLASPASEMIGRYPVYLGTLIIFGCWLVGAALAPNIGGQIAFRFLAGLCGSAPLTVAGGSMSDLWNPLEKTWTFPLFALVGNIFRILEILMSVSNLNQVLEARCWVQSLPRTYL